MTNTDKIDIKGAATEAAAGALAAAAALPVGELIDIHGRPTLLCRDQHVQVVDLEKLLPAPLHLRQTVTFTTVKSFGDYVNLFGSAERTLIFADENEDRLEAVIDYHARPDAPSWATHRAICKLETTRSWDDWMAGNSVHQNQTDFSQFLEDHIPDIATPDGGVLVELARTFEASKITKFVSHKRVDNGSVKFLFEEEVRGANQNGEVNIPSRFDLLLQPYFGGQQFHVTAKLRFRLGANGVLSLWYDLEDIDAVMEAAFAAVLAELGTQTEGHTRGILRGGPR